jgi:hypothetical protein
MRSSFAETAGVEKRPIAPDRHAHCGNDDSRAIRTPRHEISGKELNLPRK